MIELTYDLVHGIMTSTSVLVVLALIWFLPLVIALIIGGTTRGKSGNVKSKKTFIQTKGFWYLWLLWFFFQGALFVSLIFPFWLLLN